MIDRRCGINMRVLTRWFLDVCVRHFRSSSGEGDSKKWDRGPSKRNECVSMKLNKLTKSRLEFCRLVSADCGAEQQSSGLKSSIGEGEDGFTGTKYGLSSTRCG